MRKIKVLISDFQFLTREGLIHMVNEKDQFELSGVVEGADEVMKSVLQEHPDVLLMDYEGNDPVLKSLLNQVVQSKATNVLVITNEDKREHIKPLLDMGIKGIVTKQCSQSEILNAIESVSKNTRFYCNRILDVLLENEEEFKEVDCEPTDLSPREYEVLQLITKGHKTVQIADELNVSVHTINSHRKNILKKLNLKSPTELIVYALETGLVKA
ncbi:response regulator transcription factor [Marinoscillum pacificum]|uniref:response regulator transcription factor n=1 Tax=Marinoscillum pacificum TaxID=392723 RepID=UPI0021584207|nr:response regulator transcription factor [Marinoscillum pacificum]